MEKPLLGAALTLAAIAALPAAAAGDTPDTGTNTGTDTGGTWSLDVGESVSSPDGSHTLVHQEDGNVVLYGDAPLWSTETWDTDTSTLVFQPDGNLVLYGADGVPVWHTSTYGNDGAFAAVQDDGNVVVYGADHAPLWARRVAPEPRAATREYGVWDRLAQCESSGNWHINTGNGYYGGLQWNHRSWQRFKSADAPAYAHHASREQEIDAAERYRAYEQSRGRGGYGPWPSCARQLGLPR